MVHEGWGQRQKGDYSSFTATGLGLTQQELGSQEGMERCESTFRLLVVLTGVVLVVAEGDCGVWELKQSNESGEEG